MKTIKLPCYGIVVQLDEDAKGGSITSNLHGPNEPPGGDRYDAAIDGLESLILACACAGIDVAAPAFLEAIETAENAIGNHFSEELT